MTTTFIPPDGWRFMTADFSVQAYGRTNADSDGTVTFIRSPDQRARWHKLPDEVKEGDQIPLYVAARGATLEEAFDRACKAAAEFNPIPEVETIT